MRIHFSSNLLRAVFLTLFMSWSTFGQTYAIHTVAGTGPTNAVGTFGGDNGQATSGQLNLPFGVAADSVANIYIADTSNNRIRKVSNGVITTVAGNGTQGFSGDNGSAANAMLSHPMGVAVDSAGNLYIADTVNNRIRKVSNGMITTVAGIGNFANPFSIGDNGPATSAQLTDPQGIALDSAGNLYIADYGYNRIRKVSNGMITTVAGGGCVNHIADNGIGDNGLAICASLYGPTSVAVDSAGNLYIADTSNYRIRKVVNGVITTIAGNGTAGFSGDNGPATSAKLYTPNWVAVDSASNVYIADHFVGRIRKISNGVIGGILNPITTIAGNGTQGFAGDNGPATSAQLAGPQGVASDTAGNLYIADYSNNRIRILTPIALSCVYSVGPSSLQAPPGGGNLTVSIQTAGSCPWTVVGLPSWITVAGATSGAGSTTVEFQFLLNCGVTRTATILIAGVSVAIAQPTAACPNIGSITNAASNDLSSNIAPGEIVVFYGTGLGPPQVAVATVGNDGLYDTQLAGTTVSFNGIPAPMIYTSATQVAAIVPYEIIPNTELVTITVTYRGQRSGTIGVSTTHSSPGLFTSDSTGRGQAAAINKDGITVNSVTTPAKVGDVISIYATGEGQTTPAGVDGKLATSPYPTPNSVLVFIGGMPAQVLYAGGAPGEVAGLMQVNVQIPSGIQTGNAVPVLLQVVSSCSQPGLSCTSVTSSQYGVTISVAPVTSSTPGNMAGSWQFTAQSSVFGLSSSVTGQVAQIGNSVSGQLAITGTPCATSAAFNGTVSGFGSLTMNLNENGQLVVFFGALASDGNSASGTYSAPAGGCTNGDKGTWSGQRLGAN